MCPEIDVGITGGRSKDQCQKWHPYNKIRWRGSLHSQMVKRCLSLFLLYLLYLDYALGGWWVALIEWRQEYAQQRVWSERRFSEKSRNVHRCFDESFFNGIKKLKILSGMVVQRKILFYLAYLLSHNWKTIKGKK